MRAGLTLVWAGGEHTFRLGIGELRSIEQRCDAGCSVVMLRLLNQQWYIDDVIQPIRLGLIGAGMKDQDAMKLVEGAMAEVSPYGLCVVASRIIQNFIMWEKEDEPGEESGGEEHQTSAHPSPEEK